MGTRTGIIIATIITVHVLRKAKRPPPTGAIGHIGDFTDIEDMTGIAAHQ
jgi:hypothetical protein